MLGNASVKGDDGAVRLIPDLKKSFREHEFVEFDPNEKLDEKEVWIIDVVKGIRSVQLLTEKDVDRLKNFPRMTIHDFDFAFQLKLLMNLGVIERVHIVGIPYGMEKKKALGQVCDAIRKMNLG